MTIIAILLTLAGLAAFVALRGGLSAVARSRAYKSGTGWCFWRWTETPSNYILRLHVLKTPWFAVCLHWINGPDPEPYLHDHPVSFLSLILRGWYGERRYYGKHDLYSAHVHAWYNYIRASKDDAHSIVAVSPGGALTLCFMGPKTREWGFHTKLGWEHWKSYNDRVYKPLTKEALDRIMRDVFGPASKQLTLDFGDEEPTNPRERNPVQAFFTSSDDLKRGEP